MNPTAILGMHKLHIKKRFAQLLYPLLKSKLLKFVSLSIILKESKEANLLISIILSEFAANRNT